MRLPESCERVAVMVRKEFQQIFRDSRMLRVIFLAPLVQLVVFGYAVSTDVRHTSTLLVDHDRTQASRELAELLTASGYFRIVERSSRSGDLVDALDHGRAIVGVEIPAGFARDLATGRGATVQILVDGTNSNTALIARGYAERIVQSYAVRAAGPGATAAVELRERAWFNPALTSRNYNVPAVVGADRAPGVPAADRARGGARARDRHPRTAHGEPAAPGGADRRQDDPLRAPRVARRGADHHRRPVVVPRAVHGQLVALPGGERALPALGAGDGAACCRRSPAPSRRPSW